MMALKLLLVSQHLVVRNKMGDVVSTNKEKFCNLLVLLLEEYSFYIGVLHNNSTKKKRMIRKQFSKRQYFTSQNLNSIQCVKEQLLNRNLSCKELVEKCLERIESQQNVTNSYISVFEKQQIIEKANKIDGILKEKSSASKYPLLGIPFSIKDNFCTKDSLTSCGSNMLRKFIPPYDATVYKKLTDAGAICVGKTNMDEFGMGSGTTFSHYGESKTVVNGKQYIGGGSSGGSAISLKTNPFLYFSIGSDTGGSVRQPASYTGLVGLKPTYGTISRYGLISFASSLDTVGILTKSVKDSALIYSILQGADPEHDSSNILNTKSSYSFQFSDINFETNNLKGKKIGIPIEYIIDELSDELLHKWSHTIQILKDSGAQIYYISLPSTKDALLAYYIIAPAEASSNLSRYDGVRYGHRAEQVSNLQDLYTKTRTEGFGEEVKRRILSGTFTLSIDKYETYFKKAQQLRAVVYSDFIDAFKEVDLIMTPTTPTNAISLQQFKELNSVERYTNDIFTIPPSLAGIPAISIPIPSHNLPFGIQLIGAPLKESRLLALASDLEKRLQIANAGTE